MHTMQTENLRAFKRTVWAYYKKHKRDLPWRKKTVTPYRILVSEVMLQQTQVDRVVPKYRQFIKQFPTFRALADAPLSLILIHWQGLGYNRRAKLLKQAAETVVREYDGALLRDEHERMKLPGIGAYSASAIGAFAFNEPVVFIETNIRTVFLHHFFPRRRNVPDKALLLLIEKTLDRKNPREWYAALMDYGAMLKRTGENPSRRSAHHTRQSRFEGSTRQVRGAIIRMLCVEGTATEAALVKKLKTERERVYVELQKLVKEGLIIKRGKWYALDGTVVH